MTLKDAITLGRVSNLPTVWTNVLAAFVLSSAELSALSVLAACLALSLMYTGGMYLNDAFDRDIDALRRPERPIPAGRVHAKTVFVAGFAQLAVAVLIIGGVGWFTSPAGCWRGVAAALVLAALIIAYDVYHKNNPLSPLLMGLCRVGIYITVALLATGEVAGPVLLCALVLLCYLIGLTYTAKQENLARVSNWWPLLFLGAPFIYAAAKWHTAGFIGAAFTLLLLGLVLRSLRFLRLSPPQIPKAVVSFIAGIALVDASFVALSGHALAATCCLAGFGATLLLQRWVSGT